MNIYNMMGIISGASPSLLLCMTGICFSILNQSHVALTVSRSVHWRKQRWMRQARTRFMCLHHCSLRGSRCRYPVSMAHLTPIASPHAQHEVSAQWVACQLSHDKVTLFQLQSKCPLFGNSRVNPQSFQNIRAANVFVRRHACRSCCNVLN